MPSLPASLKRIGSIAMEKKWWCRFFRCSRAANSIVSSGIWPKFKLIQAVMHVLITCKYEKDPIKNSPRKCDDVVFPIISLWEFFLTSRAANSVVCGRNRPNFELMQAVMHVIVTCKYKKDPIKNSRENVMTPFSPLLHYASYPLPWKPEFWSDLHQNLMQSFPHLNDASDKLWL